MMMMMTVTDDVTN